MKRIYVIPAKAGIQGSQRGRPEALDPRLRGDDGEEALDPRLRGDDEEGALDPRLRGNDGSVA